MKENLEFKNTREMYENMPPDKRPNDILIEGKSIFEQPKTPAQIEVIKTAFRLVTNRLKKLRIENKPFDDKRIAFLPQRFFMNSGEYHDGDFFAVDESSEANLGTIVHELIHAQSSEWRNYDESEVEEYLNENNKSVKSGFHRHTNFKTINEGITEKIAREIINENPDEYERLKPLFAGRMEEMIEKRQKEFQENILPRKIKEIEEDVEIEKQHIKELQERDAKQIIELNNEIEKEENEEIKRRLIEFRDQQLERNPENIKYYSDVILRNIESRVDTAKEINELKIKGIQDDYSFSPQNMTSYDFNVEIVGTLIEGIAKKNKRNNESLKLDSGKEKVWEDLQKAYFTGNTMYLREVDEAFGKGFLRQLDQLHQLLSEKEQKDFIKEMKNKIGSI